jgi:hypothetical protein
MSFATRDLEERRKQHNREGQRGFEELALLSADQPAFVGTVVF